VPGAPKDKPARTKRPAAPRDADDAGGPEAATKRRAPARSEAKPSPGELVKVVRGDDTFEFRDRLPLLPLRDVVVYPYMTIPLLVGRLPSINAIEKAVARDRMLFVTAQRRSEVADPSHEELYGIGTVVRVLQLFRLPDGTMRVLVEGLCRARVERFHWSSDFYTVRIRVLDEDRPKGAPLEAMQRHVLQLFNDYVHLNRRIPDEVLMTANNIADATTLSYTLAANLLVKVPKKQKLLELDGAESRMRLLGEMLAAELEIVKLERKIEGQVRSQVHKNQKEFYLNEQLKAIRKELGHQNEFAGELEDMQQAIRKARMPREVTAKAIKELDRLTKMSFMSPEATVVRNYLDWLVTLPWSKATKDSDDLSVVESVLDEDHYGLRRIKDRIVEYLSVIKLTGHNRGPILCFVGPPGVGKTSLGRSIARALGRKFVRVSLGGVRDEAEIRGHRRTYIGSMPGRIIQSLRRAGSKNPVFLLDEIDKLGADYRGDPASALLEVLDPEQNVMFVDHYLDVPFDLSQVLFVTTANYLDPVLPALRDRMEVIELTGYTDREKQEIAKRHLIPKAIRDNGLETLGLEITDDAVLRVAREYTAEAGLRNLEREIANLLRRTAKKIAEDKPVDRVIGPDAVRELLGPPRFEDEKAALLDQPGAALGLAWTPSGGEVLTIEATAMPGERGLILTGQLGDVMKESATAALSYIRSHADRLNIDPQIFVQADIHVHVPAGAIPKDGPSAGVALCMAMVSLLTTRKARPHIAMTGEITLRGMVLKVGGIKEKVLGAHRAGIRTVILPASNQVDLEDVPIEVRTQMIFAPVERVEQAIQLALEPPSDEAVADIVQEASDGELEIDSEGDGEDDPSDDDDNDDDEPSPPVERASVSRRQ